MQLNIYVPKDKAWIVQALDETAKRTGRQKNDLVLEALEAHLPREPRRLKVFDLGVFEVPSREEIYQERLDKIMPVLPEP